MAATVGSLRIELSASIAQFQTDMGKAADACKQFSADATRAGNDFKKIGGQMQGIGLALSKAITLPLAGISAAVFKVGTDFEDAFAGVRKTVSGSVADLNGISDAFREMSKTIPTSATELAKIGETAGQLGVSKENIVAFTKTISDISTATHLTAEEAATSFAKLAVVMKVPQDQFESLGSAVYSLGNFGASTEKEMLDMAQRIAGAGATVGLTADQVLGLANALSSVGVNAEAGGTAMSKVLNKMAQAAHDGGKALDEFAKVAGQSSAAFKQEFQTDAGGAVVAFLEGLARIKDSGGDLLGTLDALGIKQQRTRDSMLLIANAGHLAADSIDVSSKAFRDHTAFLGAVEERYKTTSNELKVFGNRIADVGITLFTSLKPAIEAGISLVQSMIPYIDSMAKAFATLPGGVQLTVIGVGAFAAALGPAIWLAGQMVSSVATLTLAFGKSGLGTRVLIDGLSLAENAFGFLSTAVKVNGAVIGEWGSGSVILTGVAAQLTTALQGVLTLGMLPLTIATKAEAASQAFYATVVAATSGALDFLSVRLGIATLATRVKAAASAIAAAAEGALAAAIDFVNASALVATVRMAGASIATGAMAVAANISAVAVTALGVAIDLVMYAALPLVALWAGWKIGSKIAEFDGVTDAVARLVRWLDVFHLVVAASSDKDFENSLQAQHQGLDGVSDAAKQASEQFKTLKDRISGALATHDAGELTKVVIELSNEGQLTGNVMRRVAVEVANLKAQGATLTPVLENIAKAFGAVTAASGGGNGFQDLTDALKAARAELAGLSGKDLAALTEAVKSGAFSMKQIEEETGLSQMALKLFQGQVRENAKELKASQSIFDDYKKKVAELTTALSEGLKFNVPTEFIRRQFGSMIQSVEDDAGILGKNLPQIIQDAFLKITIQEGTDKLQKEFAKFGEDLNKQVKADMERVNASVIKTLGVIVDAGNSTADSTAQFSIEGLKNEIENLEKVNGETAKSHALRKQLAAEEYQYQVTLIQREGQAKKDALDETVQDYGKALDTIDQATAAKMGLASQKYQQEITKMQTSTKTWRDSLGDIASAFSAIASASGGAFSAVAKEIGSVVSALGAATKAATDFQKASEAYNIAKTNYASASASGDTAGQNAAAAAQAAAAASKIAAVVSGVAAVAQATSSKNKASAIVGGALTGAAVGANPALIAATSGLSVPIGAGIGALVGWIRAVHKGPAEKAALDVGRDFGINISDGLAKELGDLRKTIGQQAAGIFDLDKIIAEGGGLRTDNIQAYTAKLRDTFVLVKTGALTAADGAGVLDKNFANFANEFLSNGPLISKQLVEIVKLTDDLGAKSKAVADFVNQQVTGTIVPGLQAYTDASKNANATIADDSKQLADLKDNLSDKDAQDLAKIIDLKKKMSTADAEHAAAYQEQIDNIRSKQSDQLTQIDKLTAEIDKQKTLLGTVAVTSQGAADAMSATVAVAFSEMLKAGTPILEIADKLSPVVAELGSEFEAAGFSGGAAFDKISRLVALASDEIAGPAVTAATGLGQALAGLSNIGQLDQGTFTGLTDQIDATFNSLVSQGASGSDVLALMQQPLQTIWELATQFGFAIDDGTKALLEQAQAAGVVGEKQKPLQEQMLDATNKIADAVTGLAKAFGVDLPNAVATGAGAVTARAKDMAGAIGAASATAKDVSGSIGDLPASIADASAKSVGQVQALADSLKTSVTAGATSAASSVADIPAAMDAATAETTASAQKLALAMGLAVTSGAATSSDAMGGIPTAMSEAAQAALVSAQALAGGIGLDVVTGAQMAANAIDGIPTAMSEAAQAAMASAQDAASAMSSTLTAAQTAARETMASVGQSIRNQLMGLPYDASVSAEGITDAMLGIPEAAQTATDALSATAIAARETMASVGKSIIDQLMGLPGDASVSAKGITDALLGLSSIHVNPIVIPIRYDDPGFTPDVSTAATGGRVTSQGLQHFALGGTVRDLRHLFQPSGTDTVPAMLTPGEMVLNKRQQSTVAAALSGREGAFYGSDLADSHRTAQSPEVAAEQHFHFTIQALDQAGLREIVTRPGGVAEMVAVAAGQGKRGLDEKFRRSLRIS